MNNKSFGYRLKTLRNERGLNQVQLADELNFSKGMIAQWETGSKNPSIESLEKISNFFNVSTDYLLGKSDFKNKDESATYLLNELNKAGLIDAKNGIIDHKELSNLIEKIKLLDIIKNT